MRIFNIILAIIAASILFLTLFTCESPTNPFDKRYAKVGLILKSSFGQESDSSITDTAGNTDTIGLILYF